MNRARGVVVPVLIFGFLLFVTDLLHFNLPWKLVVFATAAVPILAIWWVTTNRSVGAPRTTVAHTIRDVADVAS